MLLNIIHCYYSEIYNTVVHKTKELEAKYKELNSSGVYLYTLI